MRLLNTTTLTVEQIDESRLPSYAILSHTWDQKELSIQDLQSPDRESRLGYRKVAGSCRRAKPQHDWIWIDTCCIDKSSSAELSEAINSMYRYYEDSDVCHVYLADFDSDQASVDGLKNCRWFTRGWTLQELLAPSNVIFWNKNWINIGTKASLAEMISPIVQIPLSVLRGASPLHCIVAQRLSWASNRETTRGEDEAYSLLGLFDVHLAPIYGEGAGKAFMRLQEEILKRWKDHTIFIWTPRHEPRNFGLLATSPKPFCKHRECFQWLDDIDSIPEECFDPYELLQPANYCKEARADSDGYVRIGPPSAELSLMDGRDTAVTLSSGGLHVSLLWNLWHENTVQPVNLQALMNQLIVVVLDVWFWDIKNKPRSGAMVILPMRLDMSLGYHSEDTHRRGNFFRLLSTNSYSTYRFRQPGITLTRQNFCVSQQTPVPQSSHMANFAFIALPITSRIAGALSVPAQPSAQLSERFDIGNTIRCTGALIGFYHSSAEDGCCDIPFYVLIGVHGRRPVPWCRILTNRILPNTIIWSEEVMSHPDPTIYDRQEAQSSVAKSHCIRRLTCRHLVSVTIDHTSSSNQTLNFEVSIVIFE